MAKMIEISAAEYERLQDCIREDGMRIAALIEENKALHQDARRLPAVDAAPVVHGRWIEDERTYPGAGLANNICSVCGKIAFSSKQGLSINRKYKFCPNCGAKMRCDDEQE